MNPTQHASRTAAIWQFYTRSFSGKVVAESHKEAVKKARRQHKIPDLIEINVDVDPVWQPKSRENRTSDYRGRANNGRG